jgi:hypothetical protein
LLGDVLTRQANSIAAVLLALAPSIDPKADQERALRDAGPD